jgi:hypothetical protein
MNEVIKNRCNIEGKKGEEKNKCTKENEENLKSLKESLNKGRKFKLEVKESEIILQLASNTPRLSDCISTDKVSSFYLKNSRGKEYAVKHNGNDWMIFKNGKITNERAKIYISTKDNTNIISNVVLKKTVKESTIKEEASHFLIEPNTLHNLEEDKTYNLQLASNTPRLSDCISTDKVSSFYLKNSRGKEYAVKHNGNDWMIFKNGKITNERAKIYISTKDNTNIISNVVLKKDYYFNYEKLLPTKTENLGISGHMIFLENNTHESFENYIVNGKIGKHFEGSTGVHCAEFAAKMINHDVVLPDGKVAAGDAWRIIENMKRQGTMKEIYKNNSIEQPTKAIYNNTYKKELYKSYLTIKEGFEKSELPMIVGVHYAYTETDLPKGLLTKALKNKIVKTSPNSHVLYMKKEYAKKFNVTIPTNLKSILIDHLKKNKHNKVPLDKIDWNSELLVDLKIYKNNKLLGNAKNLLNTKLNGEITVKGIGVSDEINGTVKQEYLALTLPKVTHNNRSLFTIVQVGQVHTDKLLSDEKGYKEVLNEISLNKISLIKVFNSDKYQKLYNEQVKNFQAKNPSMTLDKVKLIIKGQVLEKVKNDLIYNFDGENIKPQSILGREINFLYTHFFKINKVSEKTMLPVFSSKKDLLGVINKFKKTLETDEFLKDNTKVEIGIDKIKSTNQLTKYFLEQEPLKSLEVDINNPQIKRIFFMFFIKLAKYNKGTYFSEKIIEMENQIIKSKSKEIENVWFANKNPYDLFYNKTILQDFFNQIKKINKNIETNKRYEKNELFEEIPMDYLVEKLKFPFNTKQLSEICDNNSHLMRSLVMISYKEWFQGNYRKNGSVIAELNKLKDNIASSIKNNTSSGILQLRLPPQKNILMKRGKQLIEKLDDLKNSSSFTFSDMENHYIDELKKGIKSNNINRGDFRALIRISPTANFSLGSIYLKEKHNRIKFTSKKHLLKNENLKKETVYNYMILSHSAEILSPHQMNITVLDKVINHYGLSKNSVWKILDKREKSIKSPVIKGKLRIELMTQIICEEILKNMDIKKDFIKSAKEMGLNLTDEKNLKRFIFDVFKDVKKSRNKTMMELGKSGKYYFNNYALFFKILRNINPKKFNIDFDFNTILDPKRKQMGNYLGSTINDFDKMTEDSLP